MPIPIGVLTFLLMLVPFLRCEMQVVSSRFSPYPRPQAGRTGASPSQASAREMPR
jgi:hypothetical protein